MNYTVIEHPQYKAPAASTVDNFLAGRCHPVVEFVAKNSETQFSFVGNTINQAAQVWADNGRPELIQINTLG